MTALQRSDDFGEKLSWDRRMLQKGHVLSGEVSACDGSTFFFQTTKKSIVVLKTFGT